MALFLLFWFLLFLAVGMLLPSWRVWTLHGKEAWVLPNSDTAEGVASLGFKVLIAFLLVYLLLRAAGLPSTELGMLRRIENTVTLVAGLALLVSSFILIIVAQANMGAAWRIGIDHTQRSILVTSGVFRWSRNPIFLGMRLSLFGLFLIQPNAITLTVFVAGEILIQVQVRLEEAYLSSNFGSTYTTYQTKTQRWFGFLG